jgi:protein-tyrosine phosphatase
MTTGVLFVCTGNTCRSPLAVGVLRSLVRNADLTLAFEIDSAGTAVRHAGQPASPLALEAAARRGYDIAGHRSRSLTAEDLAHFIHPLAMAQAHLTTMRALAAEGFIDRPRMFLGEDVVDPYGGTARDYDRALDLIEAGCARLFERLRDRKR